MLVTHPLLNRARGLARRRLWKEAAAAYRMALWFVPRSAKVWVQYGHVLRELGRPDRALAAYRRADRLEPDSAEHRLLVGMALGGMGREEEARAALAEAWRLQPGYSIALREMERLTPPEKAGLRLDHVLIGTTGLCNASCVHCPTGKTATAHVPRVPMRMDLFRRIIDELHAEHLAGLPISGQIAFGLFGDALVDPFVLERARYVRSKFAYVPLAINTNAAAFDPKKHAALKELDVVIGLHVESLKPELFDELMQPLRFERVSVKYDQLMATFGEAVQVNFPLNRRNAAEIATSRRWFEDRGGRILLTPLASRCAEDDSVFRSLAYAPVPVRCTPAVLETVVIDCDGLVLACCQDFRRSEPIGDLRRQGLREVLDGIERRRFAERLDAGEHEGITTCSRCMTDQGVERTLAMA